MLKGLEGNYNIEEALNTRWEETPARFRAVKAPARVIIDNKTRIHCRSSPRLLTFTKSIFQQGQFRPYLLAQIRQHVPFRANR